MAKTTKKWRGGSPLTLQERSCIELRWCRDGKTVTEIAIELGRNKSSVSRELAGKPRRGVGKYRADIAHHRALVRIEKRGNVPNVRKFPGLRRYLEENLKLGWSPEQISIRLPHAYPDDKRMRIATESVYQEIYRRVHRGGNGAVKHGELDLRPYLARRHKRRAQKGFRKAQKVERDTSLPSIDDRPQVVEKRNEVGHWEDDTMVSRESTTRLKTCTERASGVHLIARAKNGTAEECDRALILRLAQLPSSTRKTLTRDRGSENRRWREIEKELAVDVYFAHAYASYERGTNENSNGLVRRYIPKKSNFDRYTDDELHDIEYAINNRPRKRHGGLTPCEVFFRATGVAIYS